MEILYICCAGCDVHKKIIKVCLLIRDEQGKQQKEFCTYGTTSEELLKLSDWLKEHGCTHVAMEGTGYRRQQGQSANNCLTGIAIHSQYRVELGRSDGLSV